MVCRMDWIREIKMTQMVIRKQKYGLGNWICW